MPEPKSRIVLRFFAVVIACLYFALLVTGHLPQQQLPQLILPSAMMVVFLVFGLFGPKRAEALLGMFIPVHGKPPVVAEQPGSGPLEMNAAPASMGNAKVIAFTAIDQRHQPTGACRHIVAGELQRPPAGLAICKYEANPG